ncbi:MAG: hypothetical protein JNJ97_11220 [Alphaproteobacteria bacterium]|nr:hypothetical protein [Alphaproteobacteria bacterium]
MIRSIALLLSVVAAPVFAQTPTAPVPAPAPAAGECTADGLARDKIDRITSTLLDRGFVGLDKMELVDGCYRATARNGRGEVVILTFDAAGELIGLGVGSAAPRFATPRDGLRPAD